MIPITPHRQPIGIVWLEVAEVAEVAAVVMEAVEAVVAVTEVAVILSTARGIGPVTTVLPDSVTAGAAPAMAPGSMIAATVTEAGIISKMVSATDREAMDFQHSETTSAPTAGSGLTTAATATEAGTISKMVSATDREAMVFQHSGTTSAPTEGSDLTTAATTGEVTGRIPGRDSGSHDLVEGRAAPKGESPAFSFW
jgi:hypothetical protein